MSGTRTPLDLDLPLIVASPDLAWGARSFVRGDVFPWRELGATEVDVVQLYTFHKLDCVPLAAANTPTGETRAVSLDDGRMLVAKAGARISVETPKQKRQRTTRTVQE